MITAVFGAWLRISGTVELEITSNPTTGETERVTVIHPFLVSTATESAQQRRFLPGADTASRAARVMSCAPVRENQGCIDRGRTPIFPS